MPSDPAKPRTIVLIRPIAGVIDAVNKAIPTPLLAICRRLDLRRYRPVIIDQRFSGWRDELDRALGDDPLLVGFTSLTGYQLWFGARIASRVRARAPHVPIVWGGVHATATPAQTLREPFVDYVVVGEGEVTFPVLVDALARDEDPAELPGVASLGRDGQARVNPRPPLLDVGELEDLPYQLVDMHRYVDSLQDGVFFGVEGSRGCVHACTFCYNLGTNQRRWRPRSAERIVANLERLHREHGARSFFVSDDSFFVSVDRAREVADRILSSGMEIRWSCEANLRDLARLDDATLRELERSGLDYLSMGVESGSERVISYLAKPVRLPDVLDFNARLAHSRIRPKFTMLTGTPIEEEEDLRASIALVQRLRSDNPRSLVRAFFLATPYPGTVYLQQCQEHGLVPPTAMAGWSDYDPFSVARHLPWVRGRKKRMFEFMMYGSLFIDDKASHHAGSSRLGRLTATVSRAYRPVARFRFDHFLHTPFPEAGAIKLVNRAQRLMIRGQS